MRAEKGVPKVVPLSPNTTFGATDAVYIPPKYNSKVLLVAEAAAGIVVLRSKDGKWESAEYLGVVPYGGDFTVVAPCQIGESLYMFLEKFGDVTVAGSSAGDRTEFPVLDITKQVETLLGL
jgi:hypothetical protein